LLKIYKDKLGCLKFKIYALTSSEDKDTIKKFTDFGVQDVIFKPLKSDDIKNIISSEICFQKVYKKEYLQEKQN